jgi:SGNH domain (fused to AT3 domains)
MGGAFASGRSSRHKVVRRVTALLVAGAGLAACSSGSTTTTPSTTPTSATVSGGASSISALPKLTTQRSEVAAGVNLTTVPQSVLTQLSGEPKSSYFASGCEQQPGSFSGLTPCVLGNQNAANVVILFGDSFSAQWAPALDALGKADGFKVMMYSRLGCAFSDISAVSYTGSIDQGCAPFRQAVIGAVNSMSPEPSMVILAEEHALGLHGSSGAPITNSDFARGVGQTVSSLTPKNKIVLVGNPVAKEDPATCLSAHSSNATACNTSLASIVAARPFLQDALAAKRAGAIVLNVATLMCTTQCPLVVQSTPVFADRWHISSSFASLSSGALGEMLGCTATVGNVNAVTTALQGGATTGTAYNSACNVVLSALRGPLTGD